MKPNLTAINRPNFFPGQTIDYRDLNRLSAQADKVMANLCQYLFTGGGIVVDALGGLEVVPHDGLSVLVQPGIALTPGGEPVLLAEERVVELKSYIGAVTKKATLVVSLRNTVRGHERFTDREDTSITGFKSEVFDAEFVVSESAAPAGCIEVFRVPVTSATSELRLAERQEEWETSLGEGVIDLRFRNRIVPQTYAPLQANDILEVRKALYQIEVAHAKIGRIYYVEDPFYTIQYLAQLHAEVLSRPFQPLKFAFLVAEFADKASRYLDLLNARAGSGKANFDRATLLATVEILDSLKVREVLPRGASMTSLVKVAQNLSRFVEFAEQKYNLLNKVEEAFTDLKHRAFGFEDKVVLGGHVFERCDLINVDNEDRYSLKAANSFARMLSTRFRNGDTLNLKGKFVKDGILTLDIVVKDPSRPVALMAHQYVRRGGHVVHYEINGKQLLTDSGENQDLANNWINRGLVIPVELLAPQGNQIRIRVEKSDLDFGFFDLAVYQPAFYEEGSK